MDNKQLSAILHQLEHASGQEATRLKTEWVTTISSQSNDPRLINIMLSQTAQFIMRSKQVQDHQKLLQYDEILTRILCIALSSRLVFGYDALRYIFNVKSDFYENNNIDRALNFPIGKNYNLSNYVPPVNQQCDVVRPYITCTSPCVWSRCLFLGMSQQGVASVKFSNQNNIVSVKTIFAPLNSRCKDHDWRMSLKIGDLIDAQDSKQIWYLSTIVDVLDNNGIKQVRVSFRYFDDNGDKKDQRGPYFGFGSQSDEVFNVMSPRVQIPHKMHKTLDYSPGNSSDIFIQDSYDILYEQEFKISPFYAVLRTNYCKSQTLLFLFNSFVHGGGIKIFNEMLINNENTQIIFAMLCVIWNSFFMIPKMAVKTLLCQIVQNIQKWTINNIKTLNIRFYDIILATVISVSLRYLSYTEASQSLQEFKKQMIILLLPLNLDRQLIALRLLFDLMKPAVPYSPIRKQTFVDFLQKFQVFLKVYQNGLHNQVIPRTKQFLKYYFQNNIISFKELQHLWRVIPFSDLIQRAALQKLLGQVSPQMHHQHVQYFVAKILQIKQGDLTVGNLSLLKILKDKVHSKVTLMKMLQYVWDLITIKSNLIKVVIELEAQLVFKSFLNSLNDSQIKFHLLKGMIKRLKQNKINNKQLEIISDYLKTFKDIKSPDQNRSLPVTIEEISLYLKQSQNIYATIMKLIQLNNNTEQVKILVKLISFLLSVDKLVDSGQIFKELYLKIKDKQLVLSIAKQSSLHCFSFSSWFFQQLQEAQKLQLTYSGFQSVKQLFLQLNSHKNNIKLLYGASKQDQNKKQTKTKFIYVLIQPHKLIGMEFLDRLLKSTIEQSPSRRIVEFLVMLMINLDESLKDQIIDIRRGILRNIILDIQTLSKQQCTDKIINDINKNLMIIRALFEESEINGLYDIVPHIESIEGQYHNLRIFNNVRNNSSTKQFQISINQNSTLWRLYKTISQIINENPNRFIIQKSVTNLPLPKRQFGTTFSDLPVSRQDTLKVITQFVETHKAKLLNQTKTQLTQEFQNILKKWFDTYKSDNDLLTIQNLHKLNNDLQKIKKVQEKIALQIILEYGNKQSCLTFANFKKYFLDRTVKNQVGVWKLIKLNKYSNNLKLISQVQVNQLASQSLPRKILMDERVFSVLFDILKNQKFEAIHPKIYNFILMLPTNQRIQKLLDTDYKIISNCSNCYQYSYLLDILLKRLKSQQQQFYMFIVNKGVEFLIDKIMKYDFGKGIASLSSIDQGIIQKILRIINRYCYYDLIENDVISTLFNSNVHYLSLKEFQDVLTNKLTKSSEQSNIKRVTMVEMNIKINYKLIAQLLNKILKGILTKCEGKQIGKHLFIQIFRLSYIICSQNLISTQILLPGLLNDYLLIRRLCSSCLYLNSLFNPETQQKITQYLLNNIPTENTYSCSQYFDFLSLLIQKSIQKLNSSFNLIGIVQNLINRILTMKTEQKRNQTFSENKVLKGQLMLINIILKKKPEICFKMSDYKTIIMKKCLFFYNSIERIQALQIPKQYLQKHNQQQLFDDYTSCKSPDNRKILLQILILLQKSKPQPNFLKNYILPLLQQLPQKIRKPINRTYSVGLYNFGSTCYMNAMLQMLGKISPFRNGLMMSNNLQSKVLFELKRLYSYLFFSQRQDYIPQKILTSFTPPINPMMQQDTTQFLSFLLHHLEGDLKNTTFKNLIDCCFQGTTSAQMICHNCKKKKQKFQQFYYYQVGVKDKNHLHEALQHNHQGQIISDWLCQFCNSKGDMTKRAVIKDVPNVMFIHLQRIVFDYETYMNTKIHTHLQFPTQLNIQPFTLEGVDLREELGLQYMKKLAENDVQKRIFEEKCLHGKTKQHYMLDLIGVIIHSGTGQAGHYYSIVKNSTDCMNGQNKQQQIHKGDSLKSQLNWIKLDDSSVSFSSKIMMAAQCFGGSMTGDWGFESSKNAYVLVYQKRIKQPIRLASELLQKQDIDKFQQNLTSNLVDYNLFKTYNQQKFYKQVWVDNHNLMIESHLIGEEYGKYFMKFVEQIFQTSNQDCKSEVVSQILFKIIPNIEESGKLLELFDKTSPTYNLFKKYLGDDKKIIQMIFHNDRNTRMSYGKYVSTIIVSCLKNQYIDSNQHITLFLNYLISLLNTQVSKNWFKSQAYFYIILKLLYESVFIQPLYDYLISLELIAKFIDFILGKDSPLGLGGKKHQIGNKHAYIDFTYGVQAILFLVQRSYLFINANIQIQVINQNQKFHLTNKQAIALSSMDFYGRMIRNKIAVKDLAGIIHRLAVNNISFSEHISRLILNIFFECKGNDIGYGLNDCVYQLLRIQDSISYYRCQMLLGCGNQTQIKSDNRIYSLDQQIYTFNSTIENLFPTEPLLSYCYSNANTFPMLIFNILYIIMVATQNHNVLQDFLVKQPSINHLHVRYYQWIRNYILEFKNIVNIDPTNIATVDQQISQMMELLNRFDSYCIQNRLNTPTLITGLVVDKKIQYRLVVPGHEKIFQQLIEYEMYAVESSPDENSRSNKVFENYLKQGKLQNKYIDSNSNILLIVRPSHISANKNKPNQAIQPTWAVEQQSNIQPFFSQIEEPNVMIQQKKQQPVIEQFKQETKQQNKLQQQNQKQNQPQVFINIQNIITSNYLRQLVIENTSDSDIWVKVEFEKVHPFLTNCLLPTKCSNRVKSGYRHTMILMNKFDYSKEWCEFPYKITIQSGDKYKQNQNKIYCFKLYGQQPQMIDFEQKSLPTSMNKIQQAQLQIKHNTTNNQQKAQQIAQQFTQKPCPVCTALNLSIMSECQVCGNPLA